MTSTFGPEQSNCQSLTQSDIHSHSASSIIIVRVGRQRAPPLSTSATWRASTESTTATPGERDRAGEHAVVVADHQVGQLSIQLRQLWHSLQVVEQAGDELAKRHRSKTQPAKQSAQ